MTPSRAARAIVSRYGHSRPCIPIAIVSCSDMLRANTNAIHRPERIIGRHFSSVQFEDASRVATTLEERFKNTLPSEAYKQLVAEKTITADPFQVACLRVFDELFLSLQNYASKSQPPAEGRSNFWESIFGRRPAAVSAPSPHTPKGIYLWGGTGCGKSMLMDLFYAVLPTSVASKRVHFHAFMLDIHAKLHAAREKKGSGDPLASVAHDLAAQYRVLCLDEIQVTDVGDAMLLKRLFEGLFDKGTVVVFTSNRPPQDLYYNGLQRELFVPFIHLVEQKCHVYSLSSPTDYRLLATPLASGSSWISPQTIGSTHSGEVTKEVSAAFEAAWQAFKKDIEEVDMFVDIKDQGRQIRSRRSLIHVTPTGEKVPHAARFAFHDLCSQNLFAADYRALAETFPVVFISDIPRLGMSERNELRRLITLIDVFYDEGVKIVAGAADIPQTLFSVSDKHRDKVSDANAEHTGSTESDANTLSANQKVGRLVTTSSESAKFDEVFAWDRAVSRLLEMQSEEYNQKRWKHAK